eukprot:gb/GECG01004524.1/.p1 GENE.gb/GECG01004524.1/~~gb/GECG01004524.1/.p1  ORF type:complete len:363 (+),score=48.15 gb/GECG01004524.1/:1-1089(+)
MLQSLVRRIPYASCGSRRNWFCTAPASGAYATANGENLIGSVYLPFDWNEAEFLARHSSDKEDFEAMLKDHAEFEMVYRRTHKVGEELLAAFQQTGFAYVSGNLLTPELLRTTLDATRNFFSLSDDAKARLKTENCRRGYYRYMGAMHDSDSIEAFNIENDSVKCVSELREEYYQRRGFPQDLKDMGTNRWPSVAELSSAESFRTTMAAYFNLSHNISQVLLVCLAEALRLHPTQLSSCCSKADDVLELKRYNALASGNDIDRLSPHKDWSMLSLLLQDRHGGLEIMHHQEGWIHSAVSDNSLLVNVGDMLEKLSKQKVLSTSHRVRFRKTDEPRHSIVFFARADWETETDEEDMIGDLMPL